VLEPLDSIAVAGALFALGYVDNLKEVIPILSKMISRISKEEEEKKPAAQLE